MANIINSEIVNDILNNYGIDEPINNEGIYQQAFIHKSICGKNSVEFEHLLNIPIVSNERLEFLGDAIMGSVVGCYVYERFENVDEGFLTRVRTKLVNGKQLSKFSKLLNFDKYILISKHVEDKCNGRQNDKLLEDLFESFIGSIYLDYNRYIYQNKLDFNTLGYQYAATFIINVIEKNIDFSKLILRDSNYKDQLLRYYQKTFECTPTWKEDGIEGPPHKRIFSILVEDNNGNVIGRGKAKSKKKAEQAASKQALLYLEQLDEHSIIDSSDDETSD